MKASFSVFLWFRALWLGLALVATGCTCSLVRNQEPAVRIGFNAWPGYEFLYWAHERGFFEREGLKVELVSFASLSDGRRALERGQIDIVGTTLFELLLARQQADLMAQAFYVMDVSAGGDEILAQGSIVDLAGLRGKTVGVEVGSVGLYLLLKALEKGSMSVSDVKLKASNQDEMLDGLRSGGLDAIVSYLPYSLRIKESLKVHSIFSSNDVPGQILDVLAASQRFIDDRPESIRGVVRAFDAAVTDAIQPGSPGMAVMAQRHGVSESSYRQSFKDGMVMIPFDEQHGRYFANGALQSLAQSMADALIKAGQLSPSVKVHGVARWLF